MVSQLTAVLDTNVLYPPTLRDMLLYAAWEGVYRPVWSKTILEELRRNLVGTAGLAPEAAAKRIARITFAFPDASVELPRRIIAVAGVDAKDQHVVVAAMSSDAGLIVTNNLRHFPEAALAPVGVQAWDPDHFLSSLLGSAPRGIMAALHRFVDALRSPPIGEADLLAHLSRHTPQFSEAARRLL